MTSCSAAWTRLARRRATSEIVSYGDMTQDEGPRPDTTLEKMAALAPLRPGGRITAALSSQIADGAAALLIASGRAVREHGLQAKARIGHLSARGDDPDVVSFCRIRQAAQPGMTGSQ